MKNKRGCKGWARATVYSDVNCLPHPRFLLFYEQTVTYLKCCCVTLPSSNPHWTSKMTIPGPCQKWGRCRQCGGEDRSITGMGEKRCERKEGVKDHNGLAKKNHVAGSSLHVLVFYLLFIYMTLLLFIHITFGLLSPCSYLPVSALSLFSPISLPYTSDSLRDLIRISCISFLWVPARLSCEWAVIRVRVRGSVAAPLPPPWRMSCPSTTSEQGGLGSLHTLSLDGASVYAGPLGSKSAVLDGLSV